MDGEIWEFYSCSLGPATAWSFSKKYFVDMLVLLELINACKNDYVLIPVGEVDCRLHLPQQAHIQNRKIEEVTSECLDKFFKVLMALKNIGFNPIAWGGHPSSTDGNGEDDSYPKYGDVHYRNMVAKLWASGLKERCDKNNIIYVSILDNLLSESLEPKPKIFQDGCHLAYEANLFTLATTKIIKSIANHTDFSI